MFAKWMMVKFLLNIFFFFFRFSLNIISYNIFLVIAVYLNNEVRDLDPGKGGIYIRSAGFVNKYQYYIQKNGSNAIWFWKGMWIIDDAKEIGHFKLGFYCHGNSPTPVKCQTWYYFKNGNIFETRTAINLSGDFINISHMSTSL